MPQTPAQKRRECLASVLCAKLLSETPPFVATALGVGLGLLGSQMGGSYTRTHSQKVAELGF